MWKRSSYLKERTYIAESCLTEGNDSQWIKLLGEEVYQKVKENHINFNTYLHGGEYVNSKEMNYEDIIEFIREYKKEHMLLEQSKNREVYFKEFYVILVEYGKRKLCNYITEKSLSKEFLEEFEKQLENRLQEVCIRTLIVKMHEFKQELDFIKTDGQNIYDYFCEEIVGRMDFILHLFCDYPVLLRIIYEVVEHFVGYYIEIYNHFRQDKKEIEMKLCHGKSANKINKIVLSTSDMHNGGKQVARVFLDNGFELLYKPRSMESEKVYAEFLKWISNKIKIEQKEYGFITIQNHSWSEIVKQVPCDCERELQEYYARLGVQLFLFYILGTKDLHCENLIASGAYPVIIDLETLTNIKGNHTRKSVKEEIVYQLLQSVLYTGILPFYAWNKEGVGINSSAISGKGGQVYPFKVPVIVNGGTEKMRIEYRHPISKENNNRPVLKGGFDEPILYKKYLVSGFKQAYGCVLENRKEFQKLLGKLENTHSRYLISDTQRYGMLLASSYHPSLLTDGAAREIFLYSMWKGRADKRIVDCEVIELLNGDIPYFYFSMSEKSIINIRGEKIDNYFEKTPIDILYEKLDALNVSDMERQSEYIDWVMDASSNQEEIYVNKVYSIGKTVEEHRRKKPDIESIVRELTEKIYSHAIWNKDQTEVSWCSFQFAANGKTWDIKPMNMYLYDGLAGMLLLLYELKQVDETASQLYCTVKKMLFRYTNDLNRDWTLAKEKRVGAYDGESSIIYAYLILNSKGEKEFLQYAIKHSFIVEKLIGLDKKFDLISGNAGAAQIMLMLYEVTRDKKYIHIAETAVTKLEEDAKRQVVGIGWEVEEGIPPMAGMAHGNSGMLMPILKLWKITQKEKYEQLAEKVWTYENDLYDSETQNWKDMRAKENEIVGVGAMAWCHGAPGILLSRILILQFLDDAKWKKRIWDDIERAYAVTTQNWRRDSWCICHGNLGNYGILSMASEILEKPNWECVENLRDVDIRLLHQEKLNPGIFNGYGGILYALRKKMDISDLLKLKN